MSYGSGWGGSPWGGDFAPSEIDPVTYDVVVEDEIGAETDVFIGLQQIPQIIAGAQSPTKVEVVFSVAMSIDSNFLNPANYTITRVEGAVFIPVLSVSVSGTSPLRRATLELGIDLVSKEYYFLTVSDTILSLTGDPSDPDFTKFQWADMTVPVYQGPLVIPISDFSGEVTVGILGNPDGQVFFSPAYDDVSSTSTLELEQLSVCTRAYDVYEMPNPPDPAPLLTWGPGITSVIGPQSVLWANAFRMGLPRMDLEIGHEEIFEAPYDFNVSAVLAETIDITAGGFMNDLRWATFPATGVTVFTTAANLSPIGPGPTTPVTLDWPKIYLSDSFPVTDQIIINAIDIEIQDNVDTVDGLTVQNITVGFIGIAIDESIAVSDSLVASTLYNQVLSTDAIVILDSTSVARTLNAAFSDTVVITEAVVITLISDEDVVVSDTITVTDTTLNSFEYGRTLADTDSLTDSLALGVEYARSGSDTIDVTDDVSTFVSGEDVILEETAISATDLVWTEGAVQYHDTTHSPAGLWNFNDSLVDSSGNGLTLTVETGTINYGDIFPGVRGAILDGLTTLVYGSSSGTLGTTGDVTIEMLLVLNAYTTSKNLVSYAGTAGGGSTHNALYQIELLNSSGPEMTWMQENGSNTASRTATILTRPPLDVLCHFAMTRISNVIRTYLNGVLVDTSSALTTPTDGSAARFRVGNTAGRGLAPPCALASLKVVGSGLSDAQIAAEYNHTIGRFYGEI